MIDHCISAFKLEQEKQLYCEYMAECGRMITKNLASIYGGEYLNKRYSDIISDTDVKPIEPGEAKNRICKKLRKEG